MDQGVSDKQKIQIGRKQNYGDVISDVPQGKVLSSVLFIIVSDMEVKESILRCFSVNTRVS